MVFGHRSVAGSSDRSGTGNARCDSTASVDGRARTGRLRQTTATIAAVANVRASESAGLYRAGRKKPEETTAGRSRTKHTSTLATIEWPSPAFRDDLRHGFRSAATEATYHSDNRDFAAGWSRHHCDPVGR